MFMQFILLNILTVFATQCDFKLDNGDYFDLSPLAKKAKNAPFSSKDGVYSVGMCGNTAKECTVAWEKNAFVTQYSTSRQADCISHLAFWSDHLLPTTMELPSEKFPHKQGFTLKFANGDWCDMINKERSVTFNFLCADEEYKPFEVIESQPCIYEADFFTKYACKGVATAQNHEVYEHVDHGLSWGWVTLILTLVAFFLYCSIGIWYNLSYMEKEGTDAIPNLGMWTAFPRYVQIGCVVSCSWMSDMYSRVRGKSDSDEPLVDCDYSDTSVKV